MKRLVAVAVVLLALAIAPASAQVQPAAPVKFLSTASNNSTLIIAGQVFVKLVMPINSTATPAFLKLYDKATAPTCGTDIPKMTIPVPASPAIVPPLVISNGLQFQLGVGFCLVANLVDNDNTSSVVGVAMNFATSRRP